MNYGASEQAILIEHRFWLQVLGDHSRFILNALSPNEKADIHNARQFIELFDQLLDQAWEATSLPQIEELTEGAFESTKRLQCFKLELLRRHLVRRSPFHCRRLSSTTCSMNL